MGTWIFIISSTILSHIILTESMAMEGEHI